MVSFDGDYASLGLQGQANLYSEHLATLRTRYDEAMTHFELDAVVLASGSKSFYFQDDHAHPFHGYSGAQQWLPFTLGSDTFVVLRLGQKPMLVWPVREDFWHAPYPVPSGDWQGEWDITLCRKEEGVSKKEESVSKKEESASKKKKRWFDCLPSRTAWLGPESVELQAALSLVAVPGLKAYVDFDKAVKTRFELAAMARANVRGAAGHVAAKAAFLAGKSELAVHLAFLQASGQSAFEEPYPGIVGLNEHAAVLHYEFKDSVSQAVSRSLLIDAGASEHGYASDITRTFVANTSATESSEQDAEFAALLRDMNRLEEGLCAEVTSGVAFRDLHAVCLRGIAGVLYEHGVCRLGVEEQLAKRIPQVFFPHGLGHLLGLQVHDVGGHQVDKAGTLSLPTEDAPFLRLTRSLEENMVVTIEPGLYFIPMLLEKMQASVPQHGCDLAKIKRLMPYGGIRIEDNVQVTAEKPVNLTREAFAKIGA
ncbi:Xaa-Pro dipeptidase [Marinomonas algarum]|uniref:Xaa-Pro dipeptidase n=1 Tax=Marinomonas algarum TaxID=2883105 RepID=A0A9X1LEN7_9GAMM|nr:Xaa-Pro dipeptidase [Marinomonas algarum]MCB5161500.1 Xaa-Pro dipeptidase [Marinomonas algarum]